MGSRLAGLFRFERILATLLTLLPLGLLIADGDYRSEYCPEQMPSPGPMANCRDSVSAFHDMADAKWYFVPLTAAVVMFIVNGLVRPDGHAHNTWLGLALLGIVVFDHENEATAHFAFAGIFFVSAMVLIAAYVTGVPGNRTASVSRQRLMLVGIVVLQAAVFVALWFGVSLFVAEWVQLVIIAGYFIAHSMLRGVERSPDGEPLAVLADLFAPLYRVASFVFFPVVVVWRAVTT